MNAVFPAPQGAERAEWPHWPGQLCTHPDTMMLFLAQPVAAQVARRWCMVPVTMGPPPGAWWYGYAPVQLPTGDVRVGWCLLPRDPNADTLAARP